MLKVEMVSSLPLLSPRSGGCPHRTINYGTDEGAVPDQAPSTAVPGGAAEVVLSATLAFVGLPVTLVTFALDRLAHLLYGGVPFLTLAVRIRVAIKTSPTLSGWSIPRALCDALSLREFLDFVLVFGGDRRSLFRGRQAEQGPYYYSASGFWATGHADVTALLLAPQGRSVLIGTSPVAAPRVFSPLAPIMVSHGSAGHTKIRKVLDAALFKSAAVLQRIADAPAVLAPVLADWRAAHPGPLETYFEAPEVVALATECLFTLLLGRRIPADAIKTAVAYNEKKLFVLLPRFMHRMAFGKLSARTEALRVLFVEQIGLRSYPPLVEVTEEVGLDLAEAALASADILLFAGVIGTSHLIGVVLDMMRTLPAMYADDATAFIYECARINPPVTSLTTVVTEPTTITWGGKELVLPVGTPLSAVLATANTDPRVWGNDARAFHTARDYSKLLSWNGPLEGRQGSRFCPGKDLSFAIASAVAAGLSDRVVSGDTKKCWIQIVTGKTKNAGTRSPALLRLHGKKGVSDDLPLPSTTYEAGADVVHTIEAPPDIGDIVALSLWRGGDRALDRSPEWFVDRITVGRVADGAAPSFHLVFPFYGWVQTVPTTILPGLANIARELHPAEEGVRDTYLEEQRAAYKYTSRHDALNDWKDKLPTSCKLKDRNGETGYQFDASELLPIPERSLVEEQANVRRSVIDAGGNNIVQIIINLFRRKPKTLDKYVKQLR